MVKPKNAKVWNEDLVQALDARYQISRRNGKRDVQTWQKARQAIEAVRKDIYCFSNGRIVNLPSLSKTAQRECEDIIRGAKMVLPAGYVPTNSSGISGGVLSGGGGGFSTANWYSSPSNQRDYQRQHSNGDDQDAAWAEYDRVHGSAHPNNAHLFPSGMNDNAQRYQRKQTPQQRQQQQGRTMSSSTTPTTPTTSADNNPFSNYSYTKSIKIRGGAYAILMAFHHSLTDVLTKSQICREGQKYCDEQMEANYMAGRTYGAWKGIDTLKNHNFVTEQNFRSNSGGRWRDAPHKFTLTRDGKLFIEALFATRPEAAPGSMGGGGFGGGSGIFGGGGGTSFCSPGRSPGASSRSGLTPRMTKASLGKNSQDDVNRLTEFVARGQVNDTVEFNVGKDRRLILHRKCDELQQTKRGLILKHSSSGTGRGRSLVIRILRTSSSTHSGSKRPSSGHQVGSAPGSAKRARMLSPAQNAAAAAEKRQAHQKAELECARIESAKKMPAKINLLDFEDDEDPMLRTAIQRSLADAKKPDCDDVINLSSDSEEEPTKRKKNKKPSASKSNKGNNDSSSSFLSDNSHVWKAGGGSPVRKKRGNKRVPSTDMSQKDNEVIEIDNRLSQSDDDDIICLDDDPQIQQRKQNQEAVTLKVMIDNRERNRNATPRELRLELQRHFNSGSLNAVLPPSMSLPQVEEVALPYGDFAFSAIEPNKILGVSVERKRVNDLVHRSANGDHLKQLHRMRQHCSVSILLLEYDLRSASFAMAYNAQDREGFDPLNSTIENEEDVYNLFGRLLMMEGPACKFIQASEEQNSLRAVGALGLMALAQEMERADKTSHDSVSKDHTVGGVQGLIDLLIEGGIPWQLAKRVAKMVGSCSTLRALYDSCPCEEAKIGLLSHVIDSYGDKHNLDLNGSPNGWSEAIYRIMSAGGDQRTTGQEALLLYREVLSDHAHYICTLYQGNSTPEEALELVLSNPETSSLSSSSALKRKVHIELTERQAARYFPTSAESTSDTFYALRTHDGASDPSSPIIMKATFGLLSSKTVILFEVQASEFVQTVLDSWDEYVVDYVSLAQKLSRKIDRKYRHEKYGKRASNSTRVLLLCGLSAAFDAHAKSSLYKLEMKAVVDMIIADLLLRTNITIIQAQKKEETRIKIVRQLALASFHFGFTNYMYVRK